MVHICFATKVLSGMKAHFFGQCEVSHYKTLFLIYTKKSLSKLVTGLRGQFCLRERATRTIGGISLNAIFWYVSLRIIKKAKADIL